MAQQTLKALQIEDNPADARLVRELLAETGDLFDVRSVESLRDALQLLASEAFDIVLLDLGLPDSQGLDTLESVREAAPHLPIVIKTGYADEELGLAALQRGAQDYLIKGAIDSDLLSRTMHYAIERNILREQVSRASEKFSLLSEAAGMLLTSEVPEQIVQSIAERMMGYLDCQAFFNYLVIPGTECMHLNAWAGIPDESARAIEELEFGTAVCGCVARDGVRIVAEDIPNTPDERTDMVASFGITAYACHPLIYHGRTIGTLSFGTTKRSSFTDDELDTMRAISDMCATAMARRQVEESLRISEERYRLLFTNMTEGFALGEAIFDKRGKGVDFRFLEVNDAFLLQSGLKGDIIGKPITELLPKIEQSWIDIYCKVASTGQAMRFDNYNIDTGRHYDVYAYSPAAGRFAIIFNDVTKQKEVEQALRDSEKRLEEERNILDVIMENSPEANLVYLDRDFNLVMVNSTYAESCRMSKEAMIGRNHFDLFPHEENEEIFRRVRDTGEPAEYKEKPFEFPGQPERGVTYWDWTLTPISDSGRVEALVFSLIDVTDKVRSRMLNEALNDINEAISAVLHFDLIIERAIEKTCAILGADSAGTVFKSDEGWRVHNSYNSNLEVGHLYERAPVSELVARERRPLAISNTERSALIDDSNRPAVQGEAAESLLVIPLYHHNRVAGTVVYYFQKSRQLSQAEMDFAQKLSISLSLALDNARLYERERETRGQVQSYATRLSLLHRVSLSLNRETDRHKLLNTVLQGAAELTGAGVGGVILIEDGKTELASMYYAPWYNERCMIMDDASALHKQVQMLMRPGSETLRIGDFGELGEPLAFPEGHLPLDGLLVGALRDIRGTSRGYVMLSHKAGGRFSQEDEEIISQLAAQSSVALISAENFEHEHYVAETLQSALLPTLPRREDLDVGLIYRSASSFSRLGGDFYDFLNLDDGRLAVVIGDVCGKGLEAATSTAMIKYMLRAYLAQGLGPAACLSQVNTAACQQIPMEKFITLGLLVLDSAAGKAAYASAGHPAPLVMTPTGNSHVDVKPSVPIGVLPDYDFYIATIPDLHGSALAMYTDGLTEARPPGGEPFGERRLAERAAGLSGLPAQQVAQGLLASALEYSGGNLRDDIAIVVVKPRQLAS